MTSDPSPTAKEEPEKVIILGATSGIGQALAEEYARKGCIVGIAGRRLDKLKAFQKKHFGQIFIKQIDVTNPIKACIQIDYLIDHMQGLDTFIITAGVGDLDPELDWSINEKVIMTNVSGFTALVNQVYKYFSKQEYGTIAAVTSIAGLRGGNASPGYNASKSFQSCFLEGLRKKTFKLDLAIQITDIKAGFVDTAMAKGNGLFWVSSAQKSAKQIIKAIQNKRSTVYVTKRWRLIAWLLKLLPNWLYHRI